MQNFKWKKQIAFIVALCLVSSMAYSQGARTSFSKKTGQSDSCKQDKNTKECIKQDETKTSVETQVSKYPNVVRIEPVAPKTQITKEWEALVKASTGTDMEALIVASKSVLANPKASTNEQSLAANQLVQTYLKQKGAYDKAIEYAKIALEKNGLDNNTHYDLMLLTGQMLMAEKKYADSLLYVDLFAKETGVSDVVVNKTRGNDLYRLERYPEAATALQKAYDADKTDPVLATILMDAYTKSGNTAKAKKIAEDVEKIAVTTDPNDNSAKVKQLLVFANAKQYEKAAEVFDELYAKGQITQFNEYEAGYVSFSHINGREDQAVKVINEGIAKGIIKPDADVYSVLGQSYYFTNNSNGAIEAWSKGANLSKTGELNLLLSRVYVEESNYTKSKAEAMEALKKGVQDKGTAYLLIAESESEFGLDNRTAMIAALNEAAKYPESKDEANKQLKQAGVK